MGRPVRPIRIVGDLAYVPLTKGYEAVVDAADVPLVEGWNWTAMVEERTVYAKRGDYSTGKHRTVLLHRVIIDAPAGFVVDHRDGDGLNNRRGNLRVATTSQNCMNQRLGSHNTSGVKGVTWHKGSGLWQAQIKVDGKKRYLGLYTTPEAAHAAYAAASTEFHGEFGRVT